MEEMKDFSCRRAPQVTMCAQSGTKIGTNKRMPDVCRYLAQVELFALWNQNTGVFYPPAENGWRAPQVCVHNQLCRYLAADGQPERCGNRTRASFVLFGLQTAWNEQQNMWNEWVSYQIDLKQLTDSKSSMTLQCGPLKRLRFFVFFYSSQDPKCGDNRRVFYAKSPLWSHITRKCTEHWATAGWLGILQAVTFIFV